MIEGLSRRLFLQLLTAAGAGAGTNMTLGGLQCQHRAVNAQNAPNAILRMSADKLSQIFIFNDFRIAVGLAKGLSEHGIETVAAKDLEATLQLIQNGYFDHIALETTLLREEDWAVVRKIHCQDAQLHISALGYFNYDTEREKIEMIQDCGITNFLRAPFAIKDFRKCCLRSRAERLKTLLHSVPT